MPNSSLSVIVGVLAPLLHDFTGMFYIYFSGSLRKETTYSALSIDYARNVEAEFDRWGHVPEKAVEIHRGFDVEGAMLPYKGAEMEDRLRAKIIPLAMSEPAEG